VTTEDSFLLQETFYIFIIKKQHSLY
jgi:hypothetical protein